MIHGTTGAVWLPRQADRSAMRLEQMAKANLRPVGHQWVQVDFNLVGVGLGGQSQPLRQSAQVSVHPNGGLAKGVAPEDVGRLPAHARQ